MKKHLLLVPVLGLLLVGCGGDVVPTEVKVTSENNVTSVLEGETLQLTAEVLPSEASQEVTWASANERKATVDQNGLVTTIEAGTVKIQARAKNPKDTSKYVDGVFNLTITALPFEYRKVADLQDSRAKAGEDITLTAKIYNSNINGYIIGDETGYALVYRPTVKTHPIGSTVKIVGKTSMYSGVMQINSGSQVTISTETVAAAPAISDFTAAKADEIIGNYKNSSTLIGLVPSYHKIEGLKITTIIAGTNGTNFNGTIDGITYPIGIQGMTDEESAKIHEHDTVSFEGWFSGVGADNRIDMYALESTLEITPSDIVPVSISGAKIDLRVDDVAVFSVTPVPAEYTNWTYVSDDPTVLSIVDITKKTVKGLKVGTTTITATSGTNGADGNPVVGTIEVEVSALNLDDKDEFLEIDFSGVTDRTGTTLTAATLESTLKAGIAAADLAKFDKVVTDPAPNRVYSGNGAGGDPYNGPDSYNPDKAEGSPDKLIKMGKSGGKPEDNGSFAMTLVPGNDETITMVSLVCAGWNANEGALSVNGSAAIRAPFNSATDADVCKGIINIVPGTISNTLSLETVGRIRIFSITIYTSVA